MTRKTAAKSTALLALGLALLVLLTLFRLAFLQHFHSPGEGLTAEVRHALYLGLKFDARWVAILLVPGWLLLKNGTGGNVSGWRDRLATPWLALTLAVGVPVAWALSVARRSPTLRRRPSGGGR